MKTRKAKAWYGKWDGDVYALGPFRYYNPISEGEARECMRKQMGSSPSEVWPTGDVCTEDTKN